MSIRRIDVAPGVRVAVETAGTGPPLVLIPGAGGDRATWDPLWPRLTTAHRCVRYDLRGCGDSEDASGAGFRHADDLAALLGALGIERAAVAGVSMGARIAIDLALAYPERVDRLALLSPGLADWDWSPAWRQLWTELTDIAHDGDSARVRDLWFRHPLFATTRRDPELAARLRAEIAGDACRVWLDGLRETPPPLPHVECLHRIGVPTLLLSGAEDLPDFRLIAEIIEAMVPDLRRVDVPGAGHLLHLERPEVAARAMGEFLGGR